MNADEHSEPEEIFGDRELSWLEFNARVVANAEKETTPLLERLKFVAIAVSNLDEFYMVRVAGLRKRAEPEGRESNPENQRENDLLRRVGLRAKSLSARIASVWTDQLLPALEQRGVHFLGRESLSVEQAERLKEYYEREVHPCLTPIAIDPAHPFPHLRNQSLNVALRIEPKATGRLPAFEQEGTLLALVQVPRMLPRFVPIEGDAPYSFMALEQIIAMHANELFPGHEIIETLPFRVTRASDLEIIEEEADNLLTTIQDELRRRELGDAVRLEIATGASPKLQTDLRKLLSLDEQHVHVHPGFIATKELFSLYASIDLPELKDEPFSPVASPGLRYRQDLFRSIRERDILLFHPYESFGHVVDFIETAADDPDVVAIKQTLYRTSGDSPIVRALKRAAENGKQVTALVELKARFDEAANIAWARALEESGVHVVYGLLGLKTHCKLLLVIRQEEQGLFRYLHLSTGNYNPTTARLYTDLSLLTAREEMTRDAMLLFNVLTGYGDLPPMEKLIVSPFNLRQHIYDMVDREIAHAKAGRPSGLLAKMNSLVDVGVIRKLYEASRAGVSIDLLIRGICCLRPGIPGTSENIRVRAIIDRFLEHSRVFHWENGGEPELYLSSADWMPRNINRRIEVTFPVLDPALRDRIRNEILETEMKDSFSSWTLGPDGQYAPVDAGSEPLRAQQFFMSLARERGKRLRTTVRREFIARSASGAIVNPTLRAVEAQARRRRKP